MAPFCSAALVHFYSALDTLCKICKRIRGPSDLCNDTRNRLYSCLDDSNREAFRDPIQLLAISRQQTLTGQSNLNEWSKMVFQIVGEP